ncbi:MAG: hypothetical protein IRZ16_01540 [Myxococcaceae bacterium]|nr:hypothetical protein [Myxococcaceae bacterium]
MKRIRVLTLLSSALCVAALGFTGCDPCGGGPGTICTWAGTGEAAFNGDGLDRSATDLYWPVKIRFSPEGQPVVMDWNNHRVRVLDENGTFRTIIGNENIGDGPDDQSDLEPPGVDGTRVNLNHPTDLAFLPDGRGVLAAWHNHKIRVWDPKTGLVYVACGRGAGFAGDGGDAAAALLDQPRSVVVAKNGDLYISDQRNQRIRRIRADDHVIETVAGDGTKGFAGDDGPPLSAEFSFPGGSNPQPGAGMAIDEDGRLVIADTENDRIRQIDLVANTIVTIAGNGQKGYSGDGGKATDAALNHPRDVAIGPDGDVYVADTENHVIRRIDRQSGIITTVAGTGKAGFDGDGAAAETASLNRPMGVTFDAEGNLFIADTLNNRIRRIAAWEKP